MKARTPTAAIALLAAFGALVAASCRRAPSADATPSASAVVAQAPAPSASATPSAEPSAAPISDAGADDAGPDAGDAPLGRTEGCPEGMVLVEGEYCPDVEQHCLEHAKEYEKDEQKKKERKKSGASEEESTVSERCLRYAEPSRCLSKKKQPMRFCVDRFEWPNKKGELPATLVSWTQAKKLCEGAGKRLCGESEYNFACEGEAMLPYTYGYVRDATKCNIDKPYRKRTHKLYTYERCMKKPACAAELKKLDQRLPTGSLAACVSPFGAYDMNGNINEWVVRAGKHDYPDRSGLKGGWWGPVRGRCRPTVGFHKEDDYGYEEGFRCCADAAGSSSQLKAPAPP